jgi:hypothetical protein
MPNDLGCAVANSLLAIQAGATHVQGTATGYGERAGNADLFAVVAAVETELRRPVLPPGSLERLSEASRAVAARADVHAPERALGAAARRLHPSASETVVTDDEIRVVDSRDGADARVPVTAAFTSTTGSWTTTAVGRSVVGASLTAFVDGYRVGLVRGLAATGRASGQSQGGLPSRTSTASASST